MITVSAGKVPGKIVAIRLEGGTVLDVMKVASRECGFEFKTVEYELGGKKMLDVPFHNGRELCRREGQKIIQVLWDTPVADGDTVILVPKISGNQIVVSVGRVPGRAIKVAVIEHTEPEARMNPNAGTVADAIKAAGVRYVDGDDELFLNGRPTRLGQFLREGDEVTIKSAEAETEDEDEISVIFGRLGEKLKAVEIARDTDVEDFLADRGVMIDDDDKVIYNGDVIDYSGDVFELRDGDSVVIVKTQSCVVL